MTLAEFEILVVLERRGPLAARELHASGQNPEHRHWQGYATKLASMEKRELVVRHAPAAGLWDLTDVAREVLSL